MSVSTTKPQFLDALNTLHIQFEALNRAIGDDLPTLADLLDKLVKTLTSISSGEVCEMRYGDDEQEAKAVIHKIRQIRHTVDKIDVTIRRSEVRLNEEPEYKIVIGKGLLVLKRQIVDAGVCVEWVYAPLEEEAARRWKEVLDAIESAGKGLDGSGDISDGKPDQQVARIKQHTDPDKGRENIVTYKSFFQALKQEFQNIIDALQAFKPDDQEALNAINTAMDKLEANFNPTQNFTRKFIDGNLAGELTGIVHDVSFVSDDLYDAIFGRRKNFTTEDAVELGNRFNVLKGKGGEIGRWLEMGLPFHGVNPILVYWDHVVEGFGLDAVALGVGEEDENAKIELRRRGIDTRNNHFSANKKSRRSKMIRRNLRDGDLKYSPLKFILAINKLTKTFTTALEAFTPETPNEESITSALDSLNSEFRLSSSNDLDRHALPESAANGLKTPLRNLNDEMQKMFDVLVDKVDAFETAFAGELAELFGSVIEAAGQIDSWLYAVLNGGGAFDMGDWLEVRQILMRAMEVLEEREGEGERVEL